MSLSASPVKTYIVDDPRIDFDRQAHYLVERSGGDVTYRRWTQTSASTSSLSFNTLVPSRDTVVCGKMYVRIPITVTVTSAEPTNPVVAGAAKISSTLGLRFAPFTQCCNSIQLEFNGKVQSSNVYRYYNALMKYCNTRDEMTNDFSTMPTYLDTYSSYYDPQASNFNGVGTLNPILYQTMMNPLKNYDMTGAYEPSGRIGYLNNIRTVVVDDPPVDNDSNTRYKISFVLEEIIPISPLFWGHREVKGLIGLDTLNVNFQIKDLSRMFSSPRFGTNAGVGASGNDIGLTFAFDANSLQQAQIEFIYIKPRANVTIPREIRYPYNNIKDFATNGGAAVASRTSYLNPATGTGSITFSNIQLQGVPKRLYIFVRQADSEQNYHTTDTFARINKLTLDLGTRSGLLAEASPEALYRIAVKNGYRGTWDQWYNQTGSVLCLDFGSDVSLDLLDAPGALKQMQISFVVDYTNIAVNIANPSAAVAPLVAAPIVFTAYCIVVYDGMMILRDGEVLLESNDVSALDVADSSKVRKMAYDDIADYVYGGLYSGGNLSRFISRAKEGFGKAKTFVQDKVIPAAQKALPYVEKGAKIAAELLPALAALGYTEDQIYDIVQGKGGKLMAKKSIKQRAIKSK